MTKMLRLLRLLGLLTVLAVLCSIAVACGSSDTTATAPEPVADPQAAATAEPAETPDATTTTPPPATDAESGAERGAEPADAATMTTAEPVADDESGAEPDEAPTLTTTTVPEPAADTAPTAEPDDQPTQPAGPTTTVPVPVVERLPADPAAPADDWVAGINAAGWDFHRRLTGNAVSSPVSIGVAFSLSRAGASADSGAVLDEIFGFPEADLHGAANAVDLRLAEASAGTTTLEVANRLFPDDGFSPRPEFLSIAAAEYGAVVEPVDTADGAAAADTINDWVSQSTRGLIPRIVDAGAVQDQQLVLANTVYLKADWAEQFLPEWTVDRDFTTADNQSVTASLMRDRVPVQRRFARLDAADAVELPYRGGELAMWLIVPHTPGGLAAVEESLNADELIGLQNAAQTGLVDVTMPKWEQTLPPADLFEWLCPRGFCPGARFDGIAAGIVVSTALHGAKVIVDEKGTEAAAATAMAFPTSAPPPADLIIVADRPFLWAIVHRDTAALLFVGRLVDPTG